MMKVKEGDFDKMGVLYQRHHMALYGFLYHVTRQKDVSEDLVQNAFFRMLKYRSSFTGNGEFRAWMYHVTKNVLNDHFKKAKKTPAPHDLQDFDRKLEEELNSDIQLEKKQELKNLELAMENISDENRELLVLCRYQELKYQEIARIYNITETAVKVRVHRALNQLRDAYLKIENMYDYGMLRK